MREPIVRANILVPQEHLGNVITLCIEKRGVQVDMLFLGNQVQVTYDLPMNEVVWTSSTVSNPPAAAMLRWTTISIVTNRLIW